MAGLFAIIVAALFVQDNSEFITDMNNKLDSGCTFAYAGKQYAREDVPHIASEDLYIYFSMEPCVE